MSRTALEFAEYFKRSDVAWLNREDMDTCDKRRARGPESGKVLLGRRALILDQVDDSHKTLHYAISELQKDVERELEKLPESERDAKRTKFNTMYVILNKLKQKFAELPADIPYFTGAEIEDLWMERLSRVDPSMCVLCDVLQVTSRQAYTRALRRARRRPGCTARARPRPSSTTSTTLVVTRMTTAASTRLGLPSWLSWKDDCLSGVPPREVQSCDITAEAQFMQDGNLEEVLAHTIYITIMPMANVDSSLTPSSRRPSLVGDVHNPRRIQSNSMGSQLQPPVTRTRLLYF
ncbi:Hypoxanthine-guanine phosphoribosyltransferase [Grifola frondosa]|uniref:Hypoxanthine-guanine phosphoribosyltransferase n=1 Tax=Grifola frondosa TaxID=5627 RepID=A0A1C7M8H3_GRIFR|nr:Hypoxanthine-guanine phosphoribosyltransferase [Grifola frondosa]